MRLIDADTLMAEFTGNFNGGYYTVPEIKAMIDTAPTVELIDEAAIEHLQASGWMQNHDREMSKPHWISVKDSEGRECVG